MRDAQIAGRVDDVGAGIARENLKFVVGRDVDRLDHRAVDTSADRGGRCGIIVARE
jgi:hypothetical protein